MGLTSIVKKAWQSLASYTVRPLSETPGIIWNGHSSIAGVDVTPDDALSLSAVFAAINLMARTISTLPLQVYRRYGREKQYATTHPAYRLLHGQPNPEMTGCTFRRVLEWHRLLYGNAYAEIVWAGNGKPMALWPIEPWRVRCVRNDQKDLLFVVDGETQIKPEDMIHVPLITNDGVVGRGWVQYAVESLGLGMAAQEFAAAFFGNGAKPGMILKHAGTPSAEARKQMRADWNERHQGSAKSQGTAVLWGGWELATDNTFNAAESQLIEQRRFTTEEVSRWLGIPPHLLRDLSRATFSNIEQQGADFLIYSLNPILIDYEQEFDRKLLWPPDVYCKHNVSALLRADSAARSAFYREMFNIGVLSINEIRSLEDLNPIAGGDSHFVPLNMSTLQSAVAPPVPPEPVAAPTADVAPIKPPEQPTAQFEPAPQATPPVAQTSAQAIGVVMTTLTRLQRVECNAIERQANKPNGFLAWSDQFYGKHRLRLAEALAPVFLAAGIEQPADEAARIWCDESQQRLLELTDKATSKTFGDEIKKLQKEWSARPKLFLMSITEVEPCQK